MKKLFIVLFLALALGFNLSAAKVKKVGVHPKVVTVADNRYTISEFENSPGSDDVGRTAAVSTIAAAITLLDGRGGIIQVENETPVDADLTIPSNVMLVLPPTAVFNVAATKTLTINCQVQGVVTNTGSGTVAYGTSYSSPTSFPGPVHEYYVDGGRTDSYTADGSITRPYSTIKLATDAINADVLVHGTAGTGDAANYRVHVGAGTYTGNLTITGPRSLRIEGTGVVISGTILINSGVGSYDRIEFVGTEGNRSEKGPAMTLSGAITLTRSNDSLIYVAFKGCLITGALSTVTDGTWVLCYKDCRVNGAITGTFSAAGHPSILIEAFGFNEFVGTISGKTSFYNVNGADMYCTINTTPYYENRFTHTSFNGSVSIVPQTPSSSALIYVDEISYRSLAARTPTITGATYSILEAVQLVSYALRVDCERTDSYTEDGSIGRPYKTIVSALAKVNADVGKSWVITVAAGTYSGHLTITGPRHLKIIGEGAVTIGGNILINSAVGAYDRIEFVGTETGFAEKGPSLTLSGTITCTRSNDSLIYLSFKGCLVSGALATTTDGTWVLQYENCRINGTIDGTFSAAGHPAILLITHGWNEFAAAISGKLSFYDANGSDFYGAINTTPYYASKFKDCSFASSVSIIPATPSDSTAITLDGVSWKSLKARTPTLTGATVTMAEQFLTPTQELYVDGSATYTRASDGSIIAPYSTILAALTVINADVGKDWIINVAPGTYADNLTITGPRYLSIRGNGATISGTILINSGVGTYDHIEFVGQQTGFSEKGPALTLSGAITCTRTNDSLIYVSFKGCYITSTLDTATDGTWVLQYDGCRVNGAITGTFSASGHPQILLITNGWNEFAAAISGKLAFYDANGSDFYGAISTTPFYASKFRHCSFNSTVAIAPVTPADSATQYLDLVSYKSLLARTPTLTGAAISILESYGGGTVATTGNAVVDTNSGSVHTSTFTLSSVALTLTAAGAGVGFGNVKMYDFPQGHIYIIGAVSDLTITSADADLADAWDGDIALGTTADDNGTLAGTEVNIIPSTTTPQATAKATTGDAVSTATEHAIIDGTTSFDLYLNLLADAADIADASTAPVAISGTITVTWINLGDN